MSQDPFEEFEFRPITEGLGFHKKSDNNLLPKSEELNKSTPASPPLIELPATQKILKSPSLSPSVDFNSSVDDVLETLKAKRQKLNFEETKQTQTVPSQPKVTLSEKASQKVISKTSNWVPSQPELSAIILDGMLIVAGVLACLIAFILTTRVDLLSEIKTLPTESVILLTYMSFSLVTFIYTLVCRLFMMQTAGEWVTDQKILPNHSQGSWSLASRLIFRSLLPLVTLFIFLPLVTKFLGYDLTGKISGASLYKEKL